MIDVQVLGPLTVADTATGTAIELGGPKQRAVLALLLIAQGRVISVDRLIDDLWHGEPPRRALAALQAYVSNLRRLLEPDRAPRAQPSLLVSRAPGYALLLEPQRVDVLRFESALEVAAASAQPQERRRGLDEALAMWSGNPYADFAGTAWAEPEIRRLDELRATARQWQAEAALACGDPAAAIPLADALRRDHPLREGTWHVLGRALYLAGRQAEALSVLREARAMLADELGLDPGPALAALEADVLAQRIPVEPIPGARVAVHTPAAEATTPSPGVRGPGERPAAGAPPLLGRHDELAAIAARAEAVAGTDAPGLCLVTGAAGEGKSTLLAAAGAALARRGWQVVSGRCPETEGAPPAWAWSQVMRGIAELEGREEVCELVQLLEAPELVADGAGRSAEMSRFLVHRRVVDALAAAARRAPVAVVIDDLHRAESETLNLFAEVAADAPVLLIGAFRPDEVGRHLQVTLGALAPQAPLRLALHGLGLDDATALVRGLVPAAPSAETMRRLVERTGGNPFYLQESARLLRSEGDLVALSAVPAGVRDVLRRRLLRLPDVAVSLLRLTALIGRTVDLDVLLRAAEVPEDVVLDGLDAGQLAGLLEVSDDAAAFTHVLVRETLIADLPRVRRVRWHRRIARALEEVRPDDVAALAYHHGAALGIENAEPAYRYAVAAADRADARFAYDVAAENLHAADRALARIPGAAAADRVRLQCRLSRTLLADGRLEAARQVRSRAVRSARQWADHLLAEAVTAWDLPTPLITRRYGTVDAEMVDAVRACLDRPGLPVDERCRLLVVLIEELYGERDSITVDAAREVLALSERAQEPTVRGLALVAYLTLPRSETSSAERTRLADELIELGESASREVFALIGRFTHVQLAAARGDLAAADVQLAEMDRLVSMFRWGQARASCLLIHGMLAHARGETDRAAQRYRDAGELFARQQIDDGAGMIMLAQFSVRLSAGGVADFVEPLAAIDSAAGDVLCDPRALALLAAGRPDEARVARRAVRPVRRDFFHSLLLTTRGIAVVALGARAEAQQVYADLLRYRGELGGADTGCYVVGPVDTVLGDLALLADRAGDAAALYAAAIDLARSCGNEIWESAARSRLEALS